MKKKIKIALPFLVLLVGAALAAAIIAARPKVERREAAAPPPLVRVVEVRKQDLRLDVASQGTVTPRTESNLVAQVGGQIVEVATGFAPGGFFRRGETLVRIDPRDYELAVAQADSRVAQARVRLELEQAEAELARQEWQELGKGDPSPLAAREPQMAEARAALQAAEATLEQARLNLERTAIRAPFEGRMQEKRVDLGQFVTPGTPVARVYSTADAEVRLPVSKRDLAFLEVELGSVPSAGGPSVRLRAEIAGENRSWEARVVRTDSTFNPRTRMLDLFARVDDPFRRHRSKSGPPLPMGLFVEAEIEGRIAYQVAALPRAALREGDQVLVVDGESRLRFRPVEVLRAERERVILTSGVEEGEQVCVSPLEAVVDGMRVRTLAESGIPETAREREERL